VTATVRTVCVPVFLTANSKLVGRAIDCFIGKLACTTFIVNVPVGSPAVALLPPPHPAISSAIAPAGSMKAQPRARRETSPNPMRIPLTIGPRYQRGWRAVIVERGVVDRRLLAYVCLIA
jgi:hypothetical protein